MFQKLRAQLAPRTQLEVDAQTTHGRIIAGGVITVVVVTLAIVGASLAKPTVRGFRTFFAKRDAVAAAEAFATGDLQRSAELGRRAWERGGSDPEVLRLLAELSNEGGAPNAVGLWEQLVRDEGGAVPSLANQIGLATAHANTGQINEAKAILRALEEGFLIRKEPFPEEVLRLRMDLAMQSNDPAEALAAIDDLAEVAPLSREEEFLRILARRSIRSGGPEVNARTAGELWELAEGGDDLVSLEALRMLMRVAPSVREVRLRLARALSSHPDALEIDLVQAIEFEFLAAGSDLEARAVIDREMGERRDWEPERLTPFLALLNRHGFSERALDLLGDRSPRSFGRAVRAYCDALYEAGRTEELEAFLSHSGESGLIPVHASLYQAHLAVLKKSGDDVVEERLVTAFLQARQAALPQEILRCAEYAMERGLLEVARTGFQEAVSCPSVSSDGCRGLIQIARLEGSAAEMLSPLLRLTRRRATGSDLSELAYVRLLLGDSVELVDLSSREALLQLPDDPQWLLNSALAAFRTGDMEEARSVAGKIPAGKLGGVRGQIADLLAGREPAESGPHDGLEEERLILRDLRNFRQAELPPEG